MTLEQNIQTLTGQLLFQIAQAMTINQQLDAELTKVKAELEAATAPKGLRVVPPNGNLRDNNEGDPQN